VRAFNLVHGDAVGLFDAAREAAPGLAMAHLGKAWVFTAANDPDLRSRVRSTSTRDWLRTFGSTG